MSKLDQAAATVTCNGSGIIRIDQIPLFKLVWHKGELWVQVRDGHRDRIAVRGGEEYVMVPLDLFVAKLVKEAQKRGC